MRKTKLIVLSILILFLISMTISTISANDMNSNLTCAKNKDVLKQTIDEELSNSIEKNCTTISNDENSNKLAAKEYQQTIRINTKNYTDWYNGNELTFSLMYTSSSSIGGPLVKYTITDSNNNIVHKQSTSNSNSFQSNFNIFKNLPDGLYLCNLTSSTYTSSSTTYLGDTFTWEVYVDSSVGVKTNNFLILTKDYKNYDNNQKMTVVVKNLASVCYKIYDSNHQVVYESTNFGLNKEEVCYLNSNYEIFKNLPNGNYICILRSSNAEGYDYFSKDAELIWTVSKTSKNNIPSTKPSSTNHYTKYLKVGKYKVPVWSDDNLNTKKNKVIKYLKKHIKKSHKLKVHGYKFKVSAKTYRKILYYKKFGYDGKLGYPSFKVKTNKYKIYKDPIYKTKKITHYKWKYAYVKVWKYNNVWGDIKYYKIPQKYRSWKYVGDDSTSSANGEYSTGYHIFKKKVPYYTYKDVKIGYKKVKLKVYAYGVEASYKAGVQFWGFKNGKKYTPLSDYYLF